MTDQLNYENLRIPVSVFRTRILGTFEMTIKYLKEEQNMRFCEIAVVLKRSQKTIWASYHHSLQKYVLPFAVIESKITVPVCIFQDRRFSVLESLVLYLKSAGLTYMQIAIMLNRTPNTIYTISKRYRKKIIALS